MSVLKDRARRERRLVATTAARQSVPAGGSNLCAVAARAGETVGPKQSAQILATRFLKRKPLLLLDQVTRIVKPDKLHENISIYRSQVHAQVLGILPSWIWFCFSI